MEKTAFIDAKKVAQSMIKLVSNTDITQNQSQFNQQVAEMNRAANAITVMWS